MPDKDRSAVNEAALQIMQPLAELMLSVRLGVGEFMALAKLAYVHAALSQAHKAGERGHPNVSRIAVETGLTRAEVGKFLQQKRRAPLPFRRGRSRADRVLAGWWNDPQFHDELGRPAVLALRGPHPSMTSLVARYSGTERPAPIVSELLRTGAAREKPTGQFEAIKKTCVNVQWDEDSVRDLGAQLARHFEALLHNLKQPEAAPTFVRAVESTLLDPQHARVLLKELTQSVEILLEGASDSFGRKRFAAAPGARAATRIALAVQLLEQPAVEGAARKRTRSARVRPRKSARGVGAR